MTAPDMAAAPGFCPDLFERIVEFNLYPLRYAHGSWLKGLEQGDLLKQLGDSASGQFFLSRYLLGCLGLPFAFDYDMTGEDARIALAHRDELVRLLLYMGIVLNGGVIRSVVRRHERTLLEECLGHEAYLFAVKKAQFLISLAALEQPPSLLIDWQHLDRFKSFLTVSGLQVMGVAYSQMPQGFSQRLLLKFPKSWSRYFKEPAPVGLSQEQAGRLLIKTYKEVNRSWQPLLS